MGNIRDNTVSWNGAVSFPIIDINPSLWFTLRASKSTDTNPNSRVIAV